MKKGILKAVFRGVVKSFPLGNVVIETINNFKAKPIYELDVEKQVEKISGFDKPHNWVSIATQSVIVAAIIYAFVTKQIDLNKLIEILNGF